MSSVADILRRVRIADLDLRPVAYVSPATPYGEVLRELRASTRPAAVVREGNRVVGIFTQRDVLYRTALEAVDPATPIGELMTPEPTTLSTDLALAAGLAAMIEGGFRQVALVDAEGTPAGLLSSLDVLGFVAGYFPETTLNLPPRLHQVLPSREGG
jgi:CBS domain-containing protein